MLFLDWDRHGFSYPVVPITVNSYGRTLVRSHAKPITPSEAQALEGKANLLRLLQEMRLTEDERAAVEDGVAAFERLLTKLADVPTPTGAASRELSGRDIIPLRPVSVRVEGKKSGPGG